MKLSKIWIERCEVAKGIEVLVTIPIMSNWSDRRSLTAARLLLLVEPARNWLLEDVPMIIRLSQKLNAKIEAGPRRELSLERNERSDDVSCSRQSTDSIRSGCLKGRPWEHIHPRPRLPGR